MYHLLRALGSASCDITHETGATISYGHCVLHLRKSHTRQEVRFATGIRLFSLRYHTRNKGYDLLRALGSASGDHARRRGYDLLRTLCLAFCDIA